MLMFGGMPGAGGAYGGGYGAAASGWGDIFDSIFSGNGAWGSDWGRALPGLRALRKRRGSQPRSQGRRPVADRRCDGWDAFRGVTHKVTYRIPRQASSRPLRSRSRGRGRRRQAALQTSRRVWRCRRRARRLVVTTHVEEHPLFKRKGADVTMEVPVSV
ncbi:MAG: hypothetical protein ACLU0O_08455 [Collinsella sp.]